MNMNIIKRILETKSNGILVEVPLIGDGTPENPYRPQLPQGVYIHIDANIHGISTIDYKNKKARVWINKKRSSEKAIKEIKEKTSKYRIIHDTENGVCKHTGAKIVIKKIKGRLYVMLDKEKFLIEHDVQDIRTPKQYENKEVSHLQL